MNKKMFLRGKDESKVDFLKRLSDSGELKKMYGGNSLAVAKIIADLEFSKKEIDVDVIPKGDVVEVKDADASVDTLTKRVVFEAKALEQTKEQEENREITFVASTDATDRSGDVIKQDGWLFDMSPKYIPFLWCHNYFSPPIGKFKKIYVEDNKLMIVVHFIEKEIYPFGDMIYKMYKSGYMGAVSVGFMPVKYKAIYENDDFIGIEFIEQILTEVSAVPVPCNQEALITAGFTPEDQDLYKKHIDDVSLDILKKDAILDSVNFCSILEVQEIRAKCDEIIAEYDKTVRIEKDAFMKEIVNGVVKRFVTPKKEGV